MCHTLASIHSKVESKDQKCKKDCHLCKHTYIFMVIHIIPLYCHLPVSCRSLVDRRVSLGNSKPHIYFFKYKTPQPQNFSSQANGSCCCYPIALLFKAGGSRSRVKHARGLEFLNKSWTIIFLCYCALGN